MAGYGRATVAVGCQLGSLLGYLSSRGPKVAVAGTGTPSANARSGLAGIRSAVGCLATGCPGSRTALAVPGLGVAYLPGLPGGVCLADYQDVARHTRAFG